MLDAMEDGETNFRFREDRGRDRKFNRTLNRLRRIFEKEKEAIREQEIFYGRLLEQVQTGIIVTDDADGRIIYCNSKALTILGLSSPGNLRQLSRTRPELERIFSRIADGDETKASLCNESSRMTVSITASSARIGKVSAKIIAVNDISNEMEENESESWTRLIRVMTHEIMNTVTPIASLSETLSGYIGTGDSRIKDGLDTIATSARGLIRFVNSYRDLTHIPQPIRSAFYLKELIDKIFSLTAEDMAAAGVRCSYSERTDDIILYADKDQISRIVINLMKNAVQAGAGGEVPGQFREETGHRLGKPAGQPGTALPERIPAGGRLESRALFIPLLLRCQRPLPGQRKGYPLFREHLVQDSDGVQRPGKAEEGGALIDRLPQLHRRTAHMQAGPQMGLQLRQRLNRGQHGDSYQLPHPVVQASGIAHVAEDIVLQDLHELRISSLIPGGR